MTVPDRSATAIQQRNIGQRGLVAPQHLKGRLEQQGLADAHGQGVVPVEPDVIGVVQVEVGDQPAFEIGAVGQLGIQVVTQAEARRSRFS